MLFVYECLRVYVCVCSSDSGWLRRHQVLLQRFLSSSILVNVVHHMRKSDLLSAQEVAHIQEMGSLKDKVHLLVEFLSVTDPHGAALQAYLQSSHLTEYNLITIHGMRDFICYFPILFLSLSFLLLPLSLHRLCRSTT